MTMTSKRRKTQSETEGIQTTHPRIFQPFRAIGYITNDIPFNVQSKGEAYFLTTCVGNNYQIYNLKHMNLLFVGPQTERPITAIASAGDFTFVACKYEIVAFKRAKEVFRMVADEEISIYSLTVFGQYIIGLCDDNTIRMWEFETQELYMELEFDDSFTVSTILHPSTYVNKILIGSTQGTMQLWNIRTRTLIYSFKSLTSPITCLSQSPVIDVVAIGMLNGTVVIHNIRLDETIMAVSQEDRVTAISFRSDGQHIMASANMHGDIALWDLDKRKLVHIMKGAHSGFIPSIQFLAGQALLVSSGADNSVKQWIFDSLDGVPRLLKYRSGHHAPPTKIRYYGNDGHFILSAARDRSLRAFSIVRDSQSIELSQGSLSKKSQKSLNTKLDDLKLPQITDFSSCEATQKAWDNILTAHISDTGAKTWSYQRKVLGNRILKTTDGSAVRVTAISACGNFGFIGTASGRVDMFNMQSGIFRRSFGGDEGHRKAITGIASDSLNKVLISGSIDATVKIWDLASAQIQHTIKLDTAINCICLQHDSDLLAVVCDDLGIRIIDIETQKIVREFWGHRNRITDMAFSPDGRWLITSSLDATIRTWDLPSGHLVDAFKVDKIVTSLTFSPTGDFLATAHVDSVGIFLWANRAQFFNISLRSISDDETHTIALPTSSGINDEEEELVFAAENSSEKEDTITPEQLTDRMITLSTLPRSKWQSLLNIETIKRRNKPKEPPKATEKAPFFLPTISGVQPKFALTSIETENHQKEPSSKSFMQLKLETEFQKLLRSGHESGDYTFFFDHMKSLNPSAVDFGLRSISLDDEFAEPKFFLEAIQSRLQSRRDFELVQSYLNVFLKIYSDIIVANPAGLKPPLEKILETQKLEVERLSEQLHYGLCLISFLRNA